MTNDHGFSLVEILIAIAVAGILIGIATISGREWLTRYEAEGQTREMYSDFMDARVSALQRSRLFFVTLATNEYAIYEDTNGSESLQTASDRLVKRKTTSYSLNSGGTTNLTFTKNGLTPTNCTIRTVSTAGPVVDCITLSFTRIIMGKWNGANCIAQ